MRDFTREEESATGLRPATSENVTTEKQTTFSESVQCCSVEIDKVVPTSGTTQAPKVRRKRAPKCVENTPQREETAQVIPEEAEQPNDRQPEDPLAGSWTDLEGRTLRLVNNGEQGVGLFYCCTGEAMTIPLPAGAADWLCRKLGGVHVSPLRQRIADLEGNVARLEAELVSVEQAKQETIDSVRKRAERAEAELSQIKVRECSVTGCDTILGSDVADDVCAVHRRIRDGQPPACVGFEQGCACLVCIAKSRKCARKGCANEHLQGSIWCSGHAACDASVSCDELPAVRAELAYLDEIMRVVYEDAWRGLAEHHAFDPVTVAICKQLRDLEARR